MKILFFGRISSELDMRELSYTAETGSVSINDVIDGLAQAYGAGIKERLNATGIVAAVEQKTQLDRDVKYDVIHELAFFPPVTGG